MTLTEIKKIVLTLLQPNIFDRLVTIIFDALTGSVPVQHIYFSGFAGLGKTRCMELVSDILARFGWKCHRVTSGISVSQFKSMLIQHCTSFSNKNVFMIDEVHDLNPKIGTLLKDMLELGGKPKTLTIFDSKGVEYNIELTPNNFMVMVATNQGLKDSALSGSTGRLTNLKLEPYQLEERVTIFTNMWDTYMGGEKLPSREAILTYCRNVRPFARAIKRQIQDVRAQWISNEIDIFAVEGVRKALKKAGYYRDGWSKQHLDVLEYLSKDPNGRLVKDVAGSPMKGDDITEAQKVLDELRHADFVLNTSAGRKGATSAGVAYLQELAKKTAEKAKTA